MKNSTLIKIILTFICIAFSTNTTNAYTDVTWTGSTSTGWTLAWSPYVVNSDLTINAWVTLTIDAWVVVKIKPRIKIISNWVINAVWNSSNYIYFTAFDDTSVDATVWDGVVTTPTAFWNWDYWKFLRLDWAWTDASILQFVKIKYFWAGNSVMYSSYYNSSYRRWFYYYRADETYRSGLQLFNSDATIDSNYILYSDTKVYQNYYGSSYYRYYTDWEASNVSAIYTEWWSPEIVNNILQSTDRNWIYVKSWGAHLQNNTISGNTNFWIYIADWTSLIENNDIQSNVWGIYLAWWTPEVKVNHVENNWTYWIYISNWTPNINNNYLIKWHTYWIHVNGWTPNINNNFDKVDETAVAVINGNTYWIWISGWTPIINTNRIESNSNDWMYFSNWASSSIINNTIKNNSRYWIYQTNWTHTIDNNSITNNTSNWVHVTGWLSDIKNNTVSNNSWIWIDIESGGSVITNNSVTSNANWIYINSSAWLITNNTITWNTGYWIISDYLDPYLVWSNNTISTNGTNAYHSHQFNMIATTWTMKDDVLDILIDRNSSLALGKTLNLVPWNTIKFSNSVYTNVYWTLVSEWTALKNITYTSINDGAWSPAAWNWNYFKINWAGSNSTSITYSDFKYWSNALYLYNTSASVSESDFTNNTTWLYVDIWSASITNNIFNNNTSYSIYISSWTPTVDSNTITWGSYWIRILNNDAQILNNDISSTTTNWIYIDNWGPLIDTNTITNNTWNWISIENGTSTVTNNTITWNTLYGLISTYLDPFHASTNNIINSNGFDGFYSHYFELNWLTTWSFDFSSQDLVIDRSSNLASWKEIILWSGSIIKVKNNIYLKSNWVITANWTNTASWKVIFTSYNDNSVGLALWNGSPAKSNWQYLGLIWTNSNWSLLNNIELKYSWAYWVYISDSASTIENSLIEQIGWKWIYINSASNVSTIKNNTIQNTSNDWVYIYAWDHLIDNNDINNALNNWVYIRTWNPDITNNTIDTNSANWIYIEAWNPNIDNNTIDNNNQYAINSYNLQIRVWANEVNNVNTAVWNTLGQYASRSTDIVDTTWNIDASTSDILINWNWYLASWKTINLASGSIIKVLNWNSFNSYWVINANGLLNDEVVFTSINDNTVWQPHGAVTPAKWNWWSVYLSWVGTNWSLLNHIEQRYGWNWINFLNSASTIQNSLIEENSARWIYINSASDISTFQDNIIRNNSSDWVYIYAWNHIVDQNNINNNNANWISLRTWNPQLIYNTIDNNNSNWILVSAWDPIIHDNTIDNNNLYAIDSYNLQIRVWLTDVNDVNTASWNTLGQYVSRSADIVDTTWDIDGSRSDVIILWNWYLASWKTINFSSGSIIKMWPSNAFNTSWIINANWTSSWKIVFTTINDNSVWQSHGSTTPAKWNWNQIFFNWTGTSWSNLDNIELRYAATYWINITNSSITIQNSLIEETSWKWIYINSNWYVSNFLNNIIRNNNNDWIHSYYWNHIIDWNTISNNSGNWIYLQYWNPEITNNDINNNLNSWIYMYSWNPIINTNTIDNNWKYAIDSYNLQIRVWLLTDVNETNTSTWNTLGQYVSRSMDIIDSVWDIDASTSNVVITWNWYLASWKTINFKPSSVIKANTNIAINSYWVINTEGTSSWKVIFTSINDNSVWQAIGTWNPAKWDWQYLYLYNTGTNWSLLDNLELRYGWTQWIYLYNTTATVQNSLIENNNWYWIYIRNSYVSTIQDNIIQNNSNDWIYNYSWNNIINWNEVKSNLNNWIYINSWTPDVRNNGMNLNTNYWLISHNLDPFLSSFWNEVLNNWKNTYYAHYFDISWTDETITFNIYVDRDSTLAAWKKLKLFPGTVVKLWSGVDLNIYWTLESIWTTVDNIIFTTVYDNTVWPVLNASNPSRWNWQWINFYNSTSDSSILEYTQVKYAYRWVEASNSAVEINHSLITESSNYWIYTTTWSPKIANTAIVDNTSYWIYCGSGTPTIEYNLLYQNTANPATNIQSCTTWSWNLVDFDPLFEDTVTYTPSISSPLIWTWDPALWNHSASWNRYDIWVVETWVEASLKVLSASIIKVWDWLIDLEWSFTQDPSNWADKPIINNQWTEEINFRLKYKWTYTVQLEATQSGVVLDSGTKDFTVY